MFRGQKFFIVLVLILMSLIVGSAESKVIKIKADEPLMMKMDFKIANTASNLRNIKISYDKSGSSLLTDVEAAINPKDPYTIVVNPPLGGWYSDVVYYLIVDKTVKLSGNKANSKVAIKAFQVDKEKLYNVSGRISFPNNQKAPCNMKVMLWAVNCNDPSIQTSREFEIKKGKSFIDYKLQLPENKSGYYLSYELLFYNDYYDNGFDFMRPTGYIGNSGVVEKQELRKKYFLNKNIIINMTLLENRAVCEATRKIIAKTVKPKMSDYEKVKEIYSYITSTVAYDYDVYSPFHGGFRGDYSGDKISHALLDKKAVCSGLTKTMKYLFDLVGIESDVRQAEVLTNYSYLLHDWNVVKLNGKYYNLDATTTNANSHLRINYDAAAIGMLFEDARIAATYRFTKNKDYKCDSYEYASRFYEYWLHSKHNKNEKGTVRELTGTIKLPEGEKAPKGGMFVSVSALVGWETKDTKDDFTNSVPVFIPEGEDSARYKLMVVSTGEDYLISARTTKYGIVKAEERTFFSQVVKQKSVTSDALEVEVLEMEEAAYITGEITVDNSIKKMDKDISLSIAAEEYDGSASWGRFDRIYLRSINIKKGTESAEFKIAIPKHAPPLVLSYEIRNMNPIKEYHTIAYLGSSGITPDYSKALLLDVNALKEKYTLKLAAKK